MFYRTKKGKVFFGDIAMAIERLHPKLVGEHIFEQLVALGLYEEFQKADTPCTLPYSFSEYMP